MTNNLNRYHFTDLIESKFEIHQYRHAGTILKNDFPEEYEQLINLLDTFEITHEDIQTPGGGKSPIAVKFDKALYGNGWKEKSGILV